MFHISLIFLPLIFTILTMAMAKSCPCELIVNESLSNNPPNSITDSTMNQLNDDETLEDNVEQFSASPQLGTSSSDLSSLYSLLRQTKSIDTSRKLFKRPSWATVGKRTASFNVKRPSWAQVG